MPTGAEPDTMPPAGYLPLKLNVTSIWSARVAFDDCRSVATQNFGLDLLVIDFHRKRLERVGARRQDTRSRGPKNRNRLEPGTREEGDKYKVQCRPRSIPEERTLD